MNVDELIAALAAMPGDHPIELCVVSQQGVTYDPVTADVTAVAESDGSVWLSGLETGNDAPIRLSVTCHCGIEHDIGTNSTVCELPVRTRQ